MAMAEGIAEKADKKLKNGLIGIVSLVDSLELRVERLKQKAIDVAWDGHLLRQLVSRFVRYDKARDRYVNFLQKELEKAGVDYESLPRWSRLHMDQDEKFCQCREIVRIVKRDPDYMWC